MDSAISFDDATCRRCGTCAAVCPNRIIVKGEHGGMIARPDRVHVCFGCGQCMAVCPTGSIAVQGLSYGRDFFDLPGSGPDERAFFDLIRTRRAVRNFSEKPVPGGMLEKIVEAITLAPPGFPPLRYGLIVVNDRGVMRQSLPHMIRLYDYLYEKMKNPVARYFIKRGIGAKRFAQLRDHLVPLLATRLDDLKSGAEDTITRRAPAMILFHADRDEELRDDVDVAATYGMLALHALGLGGSIMDIIPPAINRMKELRALFRVPEGHDVLSSIIIGFPKYRYRRGIRRSAQSVTWIQ
ncbi:MAG: nitroreductase family protein [Spirochaetes bacterium]|nr:nitroreductase family protein [Spirochaetota bacterium]